MTNSIMFIKKWTDIRGGSRRVAKILQENTLIVFDFIWIVLLSDRNFATLLDPPLDIQFKRVFLVLLFSSFFTLMMRRMIVFKYQMCIADSPLTYNQSTDSARFFVNTLAS